MPLPFVQSALQSLPILSAHVNSTLQQVPVGPGLSFKAPHRNSPHQTSLLHKQLVIFVSIVYLASYTHELLIAS